MSSSRNSRSARPVEDWDSDFLFTPASPSPASISKPSSSRLPQTSDTSPTSRPSSASSSKGKEKASPDSFFEGWNDSPPALSSRAMGNKPLDLELEPDLGIDDGDDSIGRPVKASDGDWRDKHLEDIQLLSAPAGGTLQLGPPIPEPVSRSKLVKARPSQPATPTDADVSPRLASSTKRSIRYSKSREQMPPPSGLFRTTSRKRNLTEPDDCDKVQVKPLQPSNQQATAGPPVRGERKSSFWKRLSASPAMNVSSTATQRRRSSTASSFASRAMRPSVPPLPAATRSPSSNSFSSIQSGHSAALNDPQHLSDDPGLAALLRRSSSNLPRRTDPEPMPSLPNIVHRSQRSHDGVNDVVGIPIGQPPRTLTEDLDQRSISGSSASPGGFHLPTTSPGSPYIARQRSANCIALGLQHTNSASAIPTTKSLAAAQEEVIVDSNQTPRQKNVRPVSALAHGAAARQSNDASVTEDMTVRLGAPLQTRAGSSRSKSSRRTKTETEAWDDDFAEIGESPSSKVPRPPIGSSQSASVVAPVSSAQRQAEGKHHRRQSYPNFIIPAAVLEQQKRVKEGNAAIKSFRKGIKVLQQYQASHLVTLDRAAAGDQAFRAQWQALEEEFADAWEEAALLIKVASTGQDEWTQPSLSEPSPTTPRRVTLASEEADAAAKVLRRLTPSSGASSGRGVMNTTELRALRNITSTSAPPEAPSRSLSQAVGIDVLEPSSHAFSQSRHTSSGSRVSSSFYTIFPSSTSSSGVDESVPSLTWPDSANVTIAQSYTARHEPSKSVLSGLKDYIRSLPLRPRPPLDRQTSKGAEEAIASQTPSRVSSRSSAQSQPSGGLLRTLSRARSRQANTASLNNDKTLRPVDKPQKLSAEPALPSIESQKTLYALSLTPPKDTTSGILGPQVAPLSTPTKAACPDPTASQRFARVALPLQEQHRKRPSVRNIFGSSRRTPSMSAGPTLTGSETAGQSSPAPSLPSIRSPTKAAIQSSILGPPSPRTASQSVWARAISRAKISSGTGSSLSVAAERQPSPAHVTGKGSIRSGWRFPSSTASPPAGMAHTDGDQTVRPLRHKKRQSGLGHGRPSLSAGRLEDLPFLQSKPPLSPLKPTAEAVRRKSLTSSPSPPTKITSIEQGKAAREDIRTFSSETVRTETSEQSAVSGTGSGLGNEEMVIHLTPENIPQLLDFLKACERRLAQWKIQVDMIGPGSHR